MLTGRDEKVISLLYDNYSAALYGVISRIVKSEDVAQDVLQESFIKIWKNGEKYDRSKGRLFTWMLNVSRNAAIDATRKSEYKMSAEIQSTTVDVNMEHGKMTQSPANIDLIGLKEKVAKLKPDLKAVIDLIYYGGYTQSEAAEKLKLPLGTIKTRVRIAMRELRDLMINFINWLWM